MTQHYLELIILIVLMELVLQIYLPMIKNIKEKDIVYLRYDDTNMKYIYLCVNCDNSWTTHQNK